MNVTEKTFNTGAVALNYAEGIPNGSPLVLLHGLSHRWQVFLPLISALSQTWHLYAVDLRGHGRSGRVPGGYTGEQYSRDIVAFVQKLVDEPVVIFGHSLGGMLGMWIAAHHPQLVRALILGDNAISLDALSDSPVMSLFVQIRKLLASGPSVDDLAAALAELPVPLPGQVRTAKVKELPGNDAAYLRWLAATLLQADLEVIDMVLDGRAFAGWDGAALIQGMSCPLLLLQGNPELGALISDRDVARFRAANPRAICVRFDGVGHQLYIHQSTPVLRAVLNFLGSL